MIEKKMVIVNPLGIHARPAAMIAQIAQGARAGIRIVQNGDAVDAASLLDILTLGCQQGASLVLQIDDPADECVASAIVDLVLQGFGEMDLDDTGN